MPNDLISKLTVGSTTYDIKDAWARQKIEDIGSPMHFIGITTTPLTDGSTTNPITIDGDSVTAVNGDITVYDSQEFIWTGSAWQLFGDLSDLGDLAYLDYLTVPVPSSAGTSTSGVVESTSVTAPATLTLKVPDITGDGNDYLITDITVTNARYGFGNNEWLLASTSMLADRLDEWDIWPDESADTTITWTRSASTGPWTVSVAAAHSAGHDDPSEWGWSGPASGIVTLSVEIHFDDSVSGLAEGSTFDVVGKVNIESYNNTSVTTHSLSKNSSAVSVVGTTPAYTTSGTTTVATGGISYSSATETLSFSTDVFATIAGATAGTSTYTMVNGITTSGTNNITAEVPADSFFNTDITGTQSISIPAEFKFYGGQYYAETTSSHTHNIKIENQNISNGGVNP